MHATYDDIRSLTKDLPKWWDEHGIPRYCDFHPGESSNFYAKEAALVLIECQNCRHEFQVCIAESTFDLAVRSAHGKDVKWMSEHIQDLHYGDPPNLPCCMSGPSMNSIPRRVLQFWHCGSQTNYEWQRRHDLEVEINCDWFDEPAEPA